jgi:hypothetical protein
MVASLLPNLQVLSYQPKHLILRTIVVMLPLLLPLFPVTLYFFEDTLKKASNLILFNLPQLISLRIILFFHNQLIV